MFKRLLLLACLLAPFATRSPALAQEPPRAQAVRHTIEASFEPASRRLGVSDSMALPPGDQGRLNLTLSSRADGLMAVSGAANLRITRSGEKLSIRLPPGRTSLILRYDLPLDAPPASLPPTMDNPGALASDATAGPDWAMLMPGSLWHPEARDCSNTYQLRVSAPSGIKAVTQGALHGFTEEPGRTVSAWSIARPVGRLGLCLAKYDFRESRDGPAPVQTFFLEGSRGLEQTYLTESARHLRFYQDLHGSYPFEKFAVVENPLPTGYGFPSYTLLGSQVLALPFIPATSLRHEIAHSWWGNGVLVDFSQGNWCEGLTTYVADYLAQAEVSPQAARAYRLKTLRAFADLVHARGDMPLAAFGSRHSAASQAVGYGKALFVFHMLRAFTGDEAFWEGLRRLYAEKLFKKASWEDFRKLFAGKGDLDEARSRRFFSQWLTRTGGPRLSIARAETAPQPNGGYAVRATVAQKGLPYLLKLTASVETEDGKTATTSFIMETRKKDISLEVPDRPKRLVLDPGADCFRLLDPEEIPPSVNTVKGSRDLVVIVADSASDAVRRALPRLLAGLGQTGAKMVEERVLNPQDIARYARGGLLLAGTPRKDLPGATDVLAGMPGADTAFAVLPRQGGFTALFQAKADTSAQDVDAAAAKVTHYGSFGRLGFGKGRNVVKETLEAPASPLAKDL